MIVNQYGRPFSTAKRPNTTRAINLLYNHPYTIYHAGDFRYRPFIAGDTDKTVSGASRMQYVNWSRQLFAQMAILDFAMELVCDWSIGEHYEILYSGKDDLFKNTFEDWANNTWAPNCNILGGPAYNFRNTLKQIIREVFRDGDLLQLYTFNRAGFPQLQYVRTHRVLERNGIKTIKGGRFDGYTVSDGLIKNSYGVTVGYYIQDPEKEEDDYMASIKDATLIFTSKYFDKGRGFAPLMPAILDAFSTQELDDAVQRRMKLETTLGVQYHNELGEVPPDQGIPMWPTEQDEGTGLPPVTNIPAAPPAIQPIIGGLQYVEMGKAKIESLTSNTPHTEFTQYQNDLGTRCLSSLGVPHQLLFSPTDISRAPARGISEIFRKTVAKTQQTIETFILPAVVWAVGNAIKTGAISPPANDEKWWNNIDFTRPSKFTLDAYNEGKQRMDFLKLGLDTRDDITTSINGRRGADVVSARKKEVVEIWSAAIEAKKELQQKYYNDPESLQYVNELSVVTMHNSLELMTPNGQPEPENNNNLPTKEQDEPQ